MVNLGEFALQRLKPIFDVRSFNLCCARRDARRLLQAQYQLLQLRYRSCSELSELVLKLTEQDLLLHDAITSRGNSSLRLLQFLLRGWTYLSDNGGERRHGFLNSAPSPLQLLCDGRQAP